MTTSEGPSWEAAAFCHYILNSIDRILECSHGLTSAQLNWRPPAPDTNSLYVLATHIMGNVEENILYTLFDKTCDRDREQEFRAQGDSSDLLERQWQDLRERLQQAIQSLSYADLQTEHTHPRRGSVKTLELLILVSRHCAEHKGHAELTRDLLLASSTKRNS